MMTSLPVVTPSSFCSETVFIALLNTLRRMLYSDDGSGIR
jgi:hypothetical protein